VEAVTSGLPMLSNSADHGNLSTHVPSASGTIDVRLFQRPESPDIEISVAAPRRMPITVSREHARVPHSFCRTADTLRGDEVVNYQRPDLDRSRKIETGIPSILFAMASAGHGPGPMDEL
jgi:hypothetical protein